MLDFWFGFGFTSGPALPASPDRQPQEPTTALQGYRSIAPDLNWLISFLLSHSGLPLQSASADSVGCYCSLEARLPSYFPNTLEFNHSTSPSQPRLTIVHKQHNSTPQQYSEMHPALKYHEMKAKIPEIKQFFQTRHYVQCAAECKRLLASSNIYEVCSLCNPFKKPTSISDFKNRIQDGVLPIVHMLTHPRFTPSTKHVSTSTSPYPTTPWRGKPA